MIADQIVVLIIFFTILVTLLKFEANSHFWGERKSFNKRYVISLDAINCLVKENFPSYLHTSQHSIKSFLFLALTAYGQWIPIYGAEKRFADTGLTLPSDHYLHNNVKTLFSITDGHCYRYLLDRLYNRNCDGNLSTLDRHLICFKY